jgi:hypothetical protein
VLHGCIRPTVRNIAETLLFGAQGQFDDSANVQAARILRQTGN